MVETEMSIIVPQQNPYVPSLKVRLVCRITLDGPKDSKISWNGIIQICQAIRLGPFHVQLSSEPSCAAGGDAEINC